MLISKINDLEKRIENLENKFDKMDKEIINGKNENKNELYNSDILNNDDCEILKKWFDPYNKKTIKLLYKASSDGDSVDDFYRKCEGEGPSITIVLSVDGNKFGGYTSLSWKKPILSKKEENKYYSDPEAFIFSLNKQKIYFQKEKGMNNAICMWLKRGPSFGGGNDLTIANNCLKNNKSHSTPKTYLSDSNDLNGKNNYFKVKDYEVYSISN